MCARFTLTTRDIAEAARAFAAEVELEHAKLYRPRWNVAPTDSHWIVRLDEAGRRRMVPARFGFDGYDGQLVINARSDRAAVLPTFRRAFFEGRCLVPADGFYEWHGGKSERRPLWFHDQRGKHLTFAGLAAERRGSPSFVILSTAANDLMCSASAGRRAPSRAGWWKESRCASSSTGSARTATAGPSPTSSSPTGGS